MMNVGTVDLSIWDYLDYFLGRLVDPQSYIIIHDIRLPRILAAIVAGVALSLSGLLMQIYFKNPLAGPFVLGVSSGASLGVALNLSLVSLIPAFVFLPNILAAGLGAGAIFILVIWVAKRWNQASTILIFGLMVSYFTSAVVSVLMYYATSGVVKEFTIWGMGSFQGVDLSEGMVIGFITLIAFALMIRLNHPLDQLSFGRDYAKSLGVHVQKVELEILIWAGVLTSIVTAYCGPIAFIGLMVPHVTRLIFKTQRVLHLMVLVPLVGVLLSLIALTLSQVFSIVIPINTAMSVLGAPFIIWFLLRRRVT